jgi:hypothetical protein
VGASRGGRRAFRVPWGGWRNELLNVVAYATARATPIRPTVAGGLVRARRALYVCPLQAALV